MKYIPSGYLVIAISFIFANSLFSETAQDFTAPRLNGKRFRLSEALAKGPVVLHFWDTCCPGCREALPLMERLQTKHSASLAVVAIATDTPKSQSKVKPLVKSNGYHFEVLLDGQLEVRKLFGGTESPLTVVLAPTGEVVLRRAGAAAEDIEIIERAVAGLFKAKPPSDGQVETKEEPR